MIARLIKTARSLQILHEIGQILSHQRWKELPPRFIAQECFNWSNADMWRVTWELIELVKAEERTWGLDARKMEALFQEWGPKNFSPSQVNSSQILPPPWVFECYIARIHISVTLRQLFHWNKKVLLFTIFLEVEGESFESWYSWFLSFFYLNDSWFSSRFMIHEDFWSPIHLMMFSLAT